MRDDPEDGTQGRAAFGAPGTGCLVGLPQGRLALHKTDGFEGHAAHGFGGFRAPFALPEPRGAAKITILSVKTVACQGSGFFGLGRLWDGFELKRSLGAKTQKSRCRASCGSGNHVLAAPQVFDVRSGQDACLLAKQLTGLSAIAIVALVSCSIRQVQKNSVGP